LFKGLQAYFSVENMKYWLKSSISCVLVIWIVRSRGPSLWSGVLAPPGTP